MKPEQLTRLLKPLLRILESIAADAKQLVSRIDKQKEAEDYPKQPSPPLVIQSELQLPVAIAEAYRAQQLERVQSAPARQERERQQNIRQWIKAGVEILGLFGIGATVFFTMRQWTEMRTQSEAMIQTLAEAKKQTITSEEAMNLTRENFRNDERPYIWLGNNIPSPEFVPRSGQIIWSYHLANYGKTPALKIIYDEYIKVGREQPFRRSYQATVSKRAAPLPPGKDDFSTVVSAPGISQDRWTQLLTESQSISFRVHITYTDASGRPYTTDACMYRLPGGAIAYCREGNDIK